MKTNAFITNESTKTLKKRLEELIEHSKELKFLVGFFYFSGWKEIYGSLKNRTDITLKILVGLDIDKMLGKTIEIASVDAAMSNDEKADRYLQSLNVALTSEAMDIKEFYEQIGLFVKMMEDGRLRIKKTQEPNHAKLYVFKIKDSLQGIAKCKFITGSSNLTRAGISEQNEFNVEIGDYGTEEAEKYFDELWETAVPITENPDRRKYLIDLINNKSQAAVVTPFEAYALILKTYIELHEQKTLKPQVIRLLESRDYKTYAYQLDAVNQALTILDNYNGVIIADVVGLGKSVIASMVAKNLSRRGIIICPPGLMGDKNGKSGWRKYINDFGLNDWEIRSSGDLENTAEYLLEYGDDIEVIIIDESHRFRNQDTQDYAFLSDTICRNRQIILLTATPFNNSPADIFSLLKLFIIPGKSKITLDDNLEARFSKYEYAFKRLSYITRNCKSKDPDKRKQAENYFEKMFGKLPIDHSLITKHTKKVALEIRSVLEPVLIRRNRIDLKNDPQYSKELKELSETDNPRELFYELTKEQSVFYDLVINDYFGEKGRFTGAIYRPFEYETTKEDKKLNEEENREKQQQRNLYDFMRRLIVKRFESSFGSFKRSIESFKRVHKRVLEFIEKSGKKYILDRKLMEDIYQKDIDEIEKALEEFTKMLEEKKAPKNNKVYNISDFDRADEFIEHIETDLKLFEEINKKIEELDLIGKDPKVISLVKEVRSIINEKPGKGEPQRKVIIFTEYVDTVKHIAPVLEKEFKGKILAVEGVLSAGIVDKLLSNFDASMKENQQENEYQILVTSDKLSEGVNLNRAGAVINYDIPWNPTRVIQRVGRINRIGKKVFELLRIYNFFPTEKGSDVVKSRQIAAQKMYLIHNTLGEDAKIFEIDETPTASELFKRINRNIEDMEDESFLTNVRRRYSAILSKHPDILPRIKDLPARIKTAKKNIENQLCVFRKKGLGMFIQNIADTRQEKYEIQTLLPEEALPLIQCEYNEPRLLLSERFWSCYESIKEYKEVIKASHSEISLEIKAQNNLQTALRLYLDDLEPFLPFIRTLVMDLREYRTLSKYSLRRLTGVDLAQKDKKVIESFKKELEVLRRYLGEDYLDIIIKRLGSMKSEVIIAVENIKS